MIFANTKPDGSGSHWYVMYYDHGGHNLFVVDSLNSDNKQIKQDADYLEEWIFRNVLYTERATVQWLRSNQQVDGTSCGLWVVKNVQALIMSKNKSEAALNAALKSVTVDLSDRDWLFAQVLWMVERRNLKWQGGRKANKDVLTTVDLDGKQVAHAATALQDLKP